jgi:hypothetical protein
MGAGIHANIFVSLSATSAGGPPFFLNHTEKSWTHTWCSTAGCWTVTLTIVSPFPISPTHSSSRKAARAAATAS